jgi:hypothetical protein
MDLTGTVTSTRPFRVHFTGRGRANTAIFDFVYEYDGEVALQWDAAVGQRLALVGTVLRVQDHGSGENVARAGATASFVAVKRDFVEPRDVPGVALLPEAVSMLASKLHRLRHTVWHLTRNVWWSPLDDNDRARISELGWGFARPPFTTEGALDLTNGAGEDFLFMHRRMIRMVGDIYQAAGLPPIQTWAAIPGPNTAQFSYVERDDPSDPGRLTYRYDPASSGYMVPPADQLFLDQFDEASRDVLRFQKSSAYFRAVMGQLQRVFRSPRHLASLSLGALGNLLEFTIHNQMHMRWASVSRVPATGEPAVRDTFDTSDAWDDPRYDYLGDFYSSHVNPVFWRLHGWVDDRIEDWFRAHEAAHPGAVERRELYHVNWFKPGPWVAAPDPFDWPGDDHHGDDQAAQVMLEVLEIIRQADSRQPELRLARTAVPLTSFAQWLQ